MSLAAILATLFAIAGCGSSETKTVTQTVGTEETTGASTSEPAAGTAGDTPSTTTIPDGTWRRDADYQPGMYRAPGGSACWWEQDQQAGGEAAGEGFNENYGSGEHNILIKIDAPYFKTEHCGTWVKVE
jgi:hypothetical protein